MNYCDGEGEGRDPNSIVGGLANAVQDERWKDWLFVFGTSVVVAGPFISPETNNPKLSRKIAVLNTALVQKGCYANEDERTSKAVAVVKDYKSGEDFGDFPGVKLKNDDLAHFSAGPISYASEVNTPGQRGGGGYDSGSIFMLDNITFGLEVCADHGMGRLRKATPLGGDIFVQIQLISSGGMIVFPTSVATLKGGLVSNVDGATPQTTNTNSDAAGFHSQLYSVLIEPRPRRMPTSPRSRRCSGCHPTRTPIW
jgi:hypothetical protein